MTKLIVAAIGLGCFYGASAGVSNSNAAAGMEVCNGKGNGHAAAAANGESYTGNGFPLLCAGSYRDNGFAPMNAGFYSGNSRVSVILDENGKGNGRTKMHGGSYSGDGHVPMPGAK
ncbi:hypothetical protein [Pedosphaera parvula]|uniref:Loricrin n=1 Tax=Pedosphaera parvula (strain Ellin514) TaxID=320771 RepID=B9XEP9_PEDPL|nr:hypothetical protein [Pedosphaera parvula]EEF61763.1 loricrin [Pedosphaera parvula Ellin514]